MKGYTIVILLMAGLLLLLPLPALPSDEAGEPPTSQTESQPTQSDTDSGEKPSAAECFRILVGDNVVELTEREFLIRTLAFEMSPTYHEEALKAQAVAAYTYYVRRRQAQQTQPDPTLQGADFVTPDDTFPGNYTTIGLKARWGEQYDAYYNKICRAVDAVLGKTVTYEGALIDACYFSLSNGSTESAAVVWGAEIPYLQSVASPGDRLAPDYESRVTFTAAQLKEKLTAAHPQLSFGEDPAAWLGSPTLSAAGTVTALPVGGQTLTGGQVRTALALRSACFETKFEGDTFVFTVHGYGHGVGMSQYGADYLARQGYNYEEILRYYYTDVTVS